MKEFKLNVGDKIIINNDNYTLEGTIIKEDRNIYYLDFEEIPNKSLKIVVSNKTLSPDKYYAKPYPYDNNKV